MPTPFPALDGSAPVTQKFDQAPEFGIDPAKRYTATVEVVEGDTPMGTLVIGVPNQLGLVGVPVYFQIAESDAGAAQGVSFTPGLVVRPGTR